MEQPVFYAFTQSFMQATVRNNEFIHITMLAPPNHRTLSSGGQSPAVPVRLFGIPRQISLQIAPE